MRVRFFGVRGSIPTPGPSTVRYGGNTVCVEATLADGTTVIFDAGTGLRELGKALLAEGKLGPYHHFLTHVHWDHIIGLPFFGPLYHRAASVLIYPLATPEQDEARARRAMFGGVHFPVRAEDLPAHVEHVPAGADEWRIGSARVSRVPLNHPGGAQGFRVDDVDGTSMAYVTDNELSPPPRPGDPWPTSLDVLARFTQGVGLLIHDAQYVEADMPAKHGWGHSTTADVLRLAKLAGPGRIALFHHEPERDDDALDAIGAAASAWLREHAPSTRALVAHEGLAVEL